MDVDQVGKGRPVAAKELISEQHGKWAVADEVPGAPHRVAEPEWFHLPDVGESARHHAVHENVTEEVMLALLSQHRFQLKVSIKVIFARRLARCGDEDDVLDSCVTGLLDR